MAAKLKVFIPDVGIDGIRRVYEAQVRHLHKFGIELVPHISMAELIATHGTTLANSENPHIPTINHNHGLYWSRQPWGANYKDVNFQAVNSMIRSVHITAPSEWVAVALRRGIMRPITVIHHGIDYTDWNHDLAHGNYVLWNKGRTDYVSNPGDMNKLATFLPDVKFKSTFGNPTKNVEKIGRQTYKEMRLTVQRAGVYLATTRETFGIGTLEAMASGIPVAGWDWGGQSEIIVDGETGYLAKPGDFDALAECIQKCYAERERLSKNCIQDVQDRWGWEDKIEQYADLYKEVHARYGRQSPKVSVVVTAYNLDEYLDECLQSVEDQTVDDWECVVVDDGLSDTTADIVREWEAKDKRFRYVRPMKNLGLAGARNFSLTVADGFYIRHLDADDKLHKRALEIEAGHLDAHWEDHIVYGHLVNISKDGEEGSRSDWPIEQFNWHLQMGHYNCLPSCVMARREVYEWTGGYRRRNWRNEDAHFWCLATSFGFRAKKVTQAITYYHRDHPESKGAKEWQEHGSEPDWTAWFPWRKGARDSKTGWGLLNKKGRNMQDNNVVPFGAQGAPPEEMYFWHVHDYAYPIVSVIITVGPGHERLLIDAMDSVLAQTYPDWEMIVVNDTGIEWPDDWRSPAAGHPWAKVVSTGGNKGAAAARTLGAIHAKGEAYVWLDADDYWLPTFLERTVALLEQNPGIIYTYWLRNDNTGGDKPKEDLKIYKPRQFECGSIKNAMNFAGTSILVPRRVWDIIYAEQGGWDTEIPGMEDWDFQFAAHALANTCAYRIEEPLFVYRFFTTTKREKDYEQVEDIMAYMKEKWADWYEGRKTMACGCKSKRPNRNPASKYNSSTTLLQSNPLDAKAEDKSPMLLIEYMGNEVARTFTGRSSGQQYRFSKEGKSKVQYVYREDVDHFLELRGRGGPMFRIYDATVGVERNGEDFVGQPFLQG